jgi:hypothetical protein
MKAREHKWSQNTSPLSHNRLFDNTRASMKIVGYHWLILAGGNKPGYTCTYFKFANSDLTIIIVTNLSNAPLYAMVAAIGELYLPMSQ